MNDNKIDIRYDKINEYLRSLSLDEWLAWHEKFFDVAGIDILKPHGQ